ncbi:unnamed protein product [Closterium sp. Yama58-4]|nr:unnamed protein product [Closterium sp. Yama58-4]
MDSTLLLLFAYVVLLGFGLFVFLFGESASFDGTVISSAHYWITSGVFEIPFYLLGFFFGERGERAGDVIFHFCCEQRNPLFQIIYLVLVIGGYYAFHVYCMSFIPGPYLSAIHRYTAPASLIATLTTFLIASISDPGTVTSATVQQTQALYPYDGVIYTRRFCSSCKIPRPARAKHCRVCNRCISRFDHHCGWVNNCVGENNLRYFLLFLFANICFLAYGVFGVCSILAGEITRSKVIAAIIASITAFPLFSRLSSSPIPSGSLTVYFHCQCALRLFFVVVSVSALSST